MHKPNINSYPEVNYCLRCGHKLSIREDHEKKIRPQCPNCDWIYYKNPVPAVSIVLLKMNAELLLVKRKFEPNAGEWALPGGYMEVYLTVEENALEELKEETGLNGIIEHCLGWYYGSSMIYERILNIGFRIKATSGVLHAGDDASEAAFFPLDKLPSIAFASHREFIHRETGVRPIH